MPLLKKESEIYPEEIFSLRLDEYPWGVGHVRSRQEKVLARFLAEREIPFYLPLFENARKRNGRSFISFLPLFPGYVFFRSPPVLREVIWRSRVASHLIAVPDQESFGRELEQIRTLQLAGASFHTAPQIEAGDSVQILEGAFRGFRGIVLREKGRDRLIVQISLLRQAVAAEFERNVMHVAY